VGLAGTGELRSTGQPRAAVPTQASPRAKLGYIAAAGIVVALIAGGLYYRSHRPKPLTDKDTLVLADFANTTGDPVCDGTLQQGLAAQLEQSPFLSLISDQRIAQTLTLMNQPKLRGSRQNWRATFASARPAWPVLRVPSPAWVASMFWV